MTDTGKSYCVLEGKATSDLVVAFSLTEHSLTVHGAFKQHT